MSSAFSPLEALLLFQYLSNYGVSPTVFSKISDLLKNDEQIRRSSSYDPGRLSPDALRDFYLRLLKEEARSELNAAEGNDGANGDAAASQSGSRKRKAPSPSLPTIQEASRDAHLIPQLIRKLYARYREHATIQIKEDERRYERIRHSLNEIKSGAWDERLQREIERGQWDPIIKNKAPEEERAAVASSSEGINGAVKPPANVPQDGVPRRSGSQIASTTQSATSVPTPRPSHLQPVSQSPATISPRPTPQPPILPAPGPSQPIVHNQPSHQHQHPPISPRSSESRVTSRQAQSPMLPPPPPSQTASPFPAYPYANNTHPQQLPPHSPYAPSPAGSAQSPVPAGQYPQYAQQQSPYHPHYAANQGGVILQPFSVAPQTPAGPRQPGQNAPNAANVRPGQPSQGQGFPPTSAPPATGLSPFDIAKLLATPLTIKRLPPGQAAGTPSRESPWKPLPGRAQRGPRKVSPGRPHSRSISPISERAPSPPPEQDTLRKTRRGKPLSAVPESIVPSRRTRRARGGSTTSSVPGSSVRGRTRSQSVISHAEDVSMVDTESVTGRRVKHEPSTPMESSDIVRPTTEGTPNQTARRGFHLNKRKRGAREDSEVSDLVPLAPRQDKTVVHANRNFNRLSQTITNDIQSHKHASLFSHPVRDKDAEGYSDIIRRPQDLKSIRTAITAGNRAVNAATASDLFAASTTSQPRDAGGIVILPVSEDLIPPKAIVNPGQLEKEVMRMFANAVMFNPGDDDVVHDAREMARDVEAQIAKFREVERSSTTLATLSEGGTGTARVSEADADEEDSQVGTKRRKVG